MCKIKEKIIDFNPGYEHPFKRFIAYERSWFCNHNKITHHSPKELINCKHCITEHDKNEYKLFKLEYEALKRLEFLLKIILTIILNIMIN